MTEYIPTTGEVRDALEAWMWTSRPYRPELTSADPGEALDRLLDQVRREAKAEALREVARSLPFPADPYGGFDYESLRAARVQFTHYINDRADQLGQEGKNNE